MSKCVECENYLGDEKCLKPGNLAYHPEEDYYCADFQPKESNSKIRQFDTGATRDTDIGKLDYEGFLSPLVLQRYAQYLNKHRVQSDGKLRDSDNWQKGIPVIEYMKSKARHFMSTWLIHRGIELYDKGILVDLEDSLCAELFNTMGYLFEILKKKNENKPDN
jgi:hypothetical protein